MNSDVLFFPREIQSIYIFSEAGIPLFTRSSGLARHVDETMVSGFLSAVFSFAEEVVEQGTIRTMEVGESIFLFDRACGCIFTVSGSGESSTLYLEFVLRQLISEWEREYGEKTEFLADVTSIFEPFGTNVTQVLQQTPPENILKEMERKREKKPISIPFLLGSTKKDLDKVVGAVIEGTSSIIVVGDRARVELAIDTLEHFSPFKKSLRTIAWAEKIVDTVDLLGIPPTQLAKPDDNMVVLDLVQSRVIGGQPCKFARQLLKDLEKLQEEEALRLISTRLEELTSKVNQLTEQNQTGQLDKDSFSTILKGVDSSTVEHILMICKRMYPTAYQTISELYKHYVGDAESRIESYLEDF